MTPPGLGARARLAAARAHGRTLTEIGLLAYLLAIPLGRGVPAWVREPPLVLVAAGLVLSRLPRPGAGAGLPPYGLLGPVVLFALSALLSTLLSAYPARSLARAAYAPIAFLLFLAAQEVAVSRAAYRRVLVVLAVVASLVGLDGIYQFATGASLLGAPLSPGQVSASLPNAQDVALVPILLPLGLGLTGLEARAWAARLLLGGLALAASTAVLSGSRNVWLGLLAGLGVFAGLGGRRRPLAVVLLVALAALAAGVVLDVGGLAARGRRVLDLSRDPRIGLWLVAWRMFEESPLLGKGLHTFWEFYIGYVRDVALPPGYAPELTYVPWPHNLYLEILAERGILGGVAFGLLVAGMGRALRRALTREGPPEERTVAVGLAAGLAAFLAQALFELTFFKDWPLLVLLLLAGLSARLPHQDGQAAPAR